MASYGLYRVVAFNDAIADIALQLMNEPDAFLGSFTPLDIADTLLAKEGQRSELDGMTWSLGSFALNFRAIADIRAKAFRMVETALNSLVPRAEARAIKSLSHILAPLVPNFARQPTAEENAWLNQERGHGLAIIARRLRSPAPIPLVRQLRSILRACRRWIDNVDVRDRVNALIDSIRASDELTVFDALCTRPWDQDLEYADLSDADRAHAEMLEAATEKFIRLYPSPSSQIEALERMISDAQTFEIDVRDCVAPFVERLCRRCEFLTTFTDYALNRPIADLGFLVLVALRIVRDQDRTEYRRVGVESALHASPHVAMGAANAVCYGPNLDCPIAEDGDILEKLILHSEAQIRSVAFTGLEDSENNRHLHLKRLPWL